MYLSNFIVYCEGINANVFYTNFIFQLSISEKKQKLLELIYLYISRSVFKLDTLMLALHLAHTVSPDSFQPNVSILYIHHYKTNM